MKEWKASAYFVLLCCTEKRKIHCYTTLRRALNEFIVDIQEKMAADMTAWPEELIQRMQNAYIYVNILK
jgi:hypothetical protein